MKRLRKVLPLGFALSDQAAFAVGNFLVSLVLARFLSQYHYGIYSVGFTLYTIGIGFLTGVLTEPMMVFGSGRYRDRLRQYTSILFRDFWRKVWPIVALVLVVLSLVYRNTEILTVVAAFAIASGPMLFQWVMRRACYPVRKQRLAAIGGGCFMCLALGFILLFWKSQILTPAAGVGAIGLASSASCLVIWLGLRERLGKRGPSKESVLDKGEVVDRHLGYSRWSLLTNLMSWIPSSVYLLLLPVVSAPEDAGRLRAVQNLLMPAIQLQAALAPLILQWLVTRRERSDFRRTVAKLSLVCCVPGLCWATTLGVMGNEIQEIAYGGRYNEPASILLLFGLCSALAGAGMVMSASFNANERPDQVLKGYVLPSVVTVLVGIPQMVWFGIAGVAVGILLSTALRLVLLSVQFVRAAQPQSDALNSERMT